MKVIKSSSGSGFLTSYGSGSGSTSQKVTVPTVPVQVPQHCIIYVKISLLKHIHRYLNQTSRRKNGLALFSDIRKKGYIPVVA